MNNIKFFSITVLSAALVACGGGTGSPEKPNLCQEYNLENCDRFTQPSSSSASSIAPPVNNVLPFLESFSAPNATTFFNQSYRPLLITNPEDLNNSFYYSTSGLDSGRVLVGDGKMTIGNARFTVGQRLQTTGTHINPTASVVDYKVGTTQAADNQLTPMTASWGELDLTNAWKMSFCVREFEKFTGTTANQQFMVYIDNNSTTSGQSMHGTASLLTEISLDVLEAGKRVEITFPGIDPTIATGEVRVGGQLRSLVNNKAATTGSFLQLRVPSAGVITMSDLWIGYQANTASEPAANTCTTGQRLPNWNIPMPPEAPVAPTFEPGNNQLRVSWPVASRATSYTVAYNTVDSLEGATLVAGITGNSTTITGLLNGTSYYVFVKAINNGGESAFGPSAVAVPEAPAVAPEAPTGLKVFGDSKRALVTWTKTDGAESYSLAVNTMNETTTAVVTDGITNTYQRLTGLVDNTAYYVFLKAKNAVGESIYTSPEVVTPAPSPFIYQANFAVTKDLFFGTNGPAVQTLGAGSEIPMHFIAGGGAGITLEEGGIRLASGGRFTIGQVLQADTAGVLGQIAQTTMNDTSVNGVLDLSGYYKIVISVVTAADAGNFQVYLDNNTTGGAASIHNTPKLGNNTRSRLLNQAASGIADGQEIVIDVNADRRGTATSFIQLRTDSGVGTEGILISGVRIEAIDAPVDGGSSSSEASSSAPVSSAAPSSSVAPSSEASSSSAPASSSEASSSVVPSSSSEASSSVAPSSSSEASSSSTSSAPSGGTDVSFNWASFDPATYIAILTNPVVSTANNAVLQSATPHSSNGLFFFHSATGTLRHRGGANLEWNFNGTAWASGDPVAIVGAAAEPMRAYIGVPVDAGRDVTLTVVHRNSTTAGNPLGSIVFVGSDGNVLAKYDAKVGTATTTTFNLPAGHTQTEVKILFSREGGGAGGMHLTSISKTYN